MFRIPFVLSLSIFPLTEGWSGDAHRVIAKIAAQFLNHSGKYFVAEHLADGGDASKVEKALIEHSIYATYIFLTPHIVLVPRLRWREIVLWLTGLADASLQLLQTIL
jgi:hypothetical protein